MQYVIYSFQEESYVHGVDNLFALVSLCKNVHWAERYDSRGAADKVCAKLIARGLAVEMKVECYGERDADLAQHL